MFHGNFFIFLSTGSFFYVFLIAAQRFSFSFFLMEVPLSQSRPLEIFHQCLKTVPDPRSQRGQGHVFRTVLPLIFLGILANCTTPTGLQRWAEIHLPTLRKFFRMRYYKGKYCAPHATTFTRILEKLSLADLQKAFAEFVNAILADPTLVGAVDGKAAKQMKDDEGNPILMLNVFAHTLKLHLASWEVHGDKTNEPGCLMKHLEELFEMFPCLQLLTGDAIFAQRPLLEALRNHGRDYLFQVKENQPKVLKKMKEAFKDALKQEQELPNSHSYDRRVSKKRGLLKSVVCG